MEYESKIFGELPEDPIVEMFMSHAKTVGVVIPESCMDEEGSETEDAEGNEDTED